MTAGITIEKDTLGRPAHMRIDLRRMRNNEAFQNFIDILSIEEAKKDGVFFEWEDVKKEQDQKRHVNV